MAPREFFEALASTQARAIELARAGASAGHRVVAARQTAGRGRNDRAFASPSGGLYLSVVLGRPPAASELLSLGVGACLAFGLRRRYAAPVRLKWPNDLVVGGNGAPLRKLGGILVDTVADPFGLPVAVVGVGINVAPWLGRLPETLARRSAALDELVGHPVALAELEEEVARAALAARDTLDRSDGRDGVLGLCRGLLHGVGERVAVDGRPAGRLVGLSDDGAARLADQGVELEVRSGTVSFEEVAT